MSKVERLFAGKSKKLKDGELSTPFPIANEYDKLTKGKDIKSPDEVIAYRNLSAVVATIKREKESGCPVSSSGTINLETIRQSK